VFYQAGKAVTDSFEAVAKLFERIANFASRMQTVSEAKIPPKLVPIYQTMLVSLLNICGLSISITSRYLVTEEEVPEKSSWHRNSEMKALKRNVRKFIRAPHANVKEYLKQLTGGNSKINDAVDNLNELVTFESSMMQAVTLKEVMGIKTFTMNLQGLTIELGKTMSNMQSESNFRLSHIQQSQDRMEENTIDLKKGQSQANTKLDSLQLSMEKLGRMINGVTGKQLNEPQDTKDSVSKERKRWEKLAAALEVEGAKESNKTFYERIRKERVPGTTEWIQDHEAVKSWIQGETPFVVMSGDTGNGKTFIASRIIDQLITSTTNPDKALAYFFCRRGSRERSSVIMALKTMAYDIASSDQLFAKYLMDLVADRKLQSARTAIKVDLTSTTSDLLDSNDVTIESTAITHDQIEAIEAVSDSIPAKLDALSDGGFEPTHSTEDNDIDLEPKLHRVSTAILQDKPLDNSFEEMTVWDVQRHWENLFVSRPQSFERHVYLVVDGLDECDETEAIALCAAISVSADAATSRVATKVHVLLLMNTDRVTRFESHALTSAIIVDVDPDTISTDIDKFVRHRITSAWQEKLVRRELRQESHGAVVANCDANFLKASLLVNEVTSFTREDVIRGTISNLPSLAKTVQSAMLLVIKRLANQLMFYDREDFHVSGAHPSRYKS
jgi:Cdc6-like AAA superfamily ATPase